MQPINYNHTHFSNELSVKLLDQDEYPAAARTIRAWSHSAAQKAREAEARGFDSEDFGSLAEITRNALETMELGANDDLYVCEDRQRRPQGYMFLNNRQEVAYVEMMFTHPDIIRSPLNPSRIPGVGSRLMDEAEAIATEGPYKAVELSSYTNAKEFYRKLGYAPYVQGKPHLLRKSIEVIRLNRPAA